MMSRGVRLVDRLLGPRLRDLVAEDRHRARVIVMSSAVFCATSCVLTLLILEQGWDLAFLPSTVGAALLYAANVGYLRRTGALVPAGLALCLIGLVAVISVSWVVGGPTNPALDWTLLAVMFAPFVLSTRLTVACVGLVLANILAQWVAEQAGHRFAPLAFAHSISTWSHVFLTLVVAAIALLFERARRIALVERDLAVKEAATADAARSSLADNVDAVIYSVDRDLCLISGNVYFDKLSHVPGRPPLVPGQSVLDALASSQHASMRLLFARAFGGERLDIVSRFELPSGVFDAELRLVPIKSSSGEVLAVTAYARDIGARLRAEAELQRLNRQLAEMAHLAGKAEVAADVLHNVGTILAAINGSANHLEEMLEASKIEFVGKTVALLPEAPTELARFLSTDARGRNVRPYLRQLAEALEQEHAEELAGVSTLHEQLDHMKAVVARQQAFARSTNTLEVVAIADLVAEALRMSGDHDGRGATVTVDCDAIPPVALDRHRVMEVVLNLLRNCRDALDATSPPQPRVAINVTHDDDRLRIAITDNGAGIEPEHLSRLFSYGFTTKPTGHGFDLAGSLLAARAMGGTLSAHSDGPGTGATFTLELPFRTSVTTYVQERAA